jgi:rifampicin phosphotransferase
MPQLVIPLASVRQSDSGRVGGKAATLGTLLAAGFPVPAGICVTTEAFHLALADDQADIEAILRQFNLHNPTSAQAAADRITSLLLDLAVPAVIKMALQDLLPQIANETTPLVVRSSATGEDGAEVSFAGQYHTVLGVFGEEALQAAILSCWRSFFSPNALVARAAHPAVGEGEGMAVLIQPLIEAECAGVCFSVDPVQQRQDRLVVNAGWGLGAGVVDGSVATDTTWLRRNDFSRQQSRIVEKPEQIIFDRERGLQRIAVPAEARRAACLPEAWLERIAQFGLAAELLLGHAQDMEWAIAADQVWILQSRPITGLPPELAHTPFFSVSWASAEEARFLWRKEEGLWPEFMLPLEQDHLARFETAWEEASRLLGVERKLGFKYCQGRAYSRPIPIDWTAVERRIRRAAMEDLGERLQQEGRTPWDHWGPEIIKATERLHAFDDDTATGPALAEHLEEALAVGRRHFMLHPVCSRFQPHQTFFDSFAAVTGISGAEAEEGAYRLLEGGETPFSQLVDGLYELACLARQHAEIAALIAQPPPDVLTRLKALSQGAFFLAQLDIFLDIYGERTGNGWGSEASLRTPTWRENPEKVLPLIVPYLEPDSESPATIRKRAQQAIRAQVEALCAACTDESAALEFRRQWAYACKAYAVLEIHNHYIDQMALGQLRHVVMGAARWLVAQETLAAPEEVLWLRFDEILSALRVDTPISFAETVATRQAEYAEWSKLEAPPILGLPEAQLPPRPPLQDEVTLDGPDDTTHLAGQGASAGQASGRVRLALDPILLPNLEPGDILVASNIGPLWTPIFPRLGGLILESGSVGQHAAATAREYGIPAVVGVKHATKRLSEGGWVSIDGTLGLVTIHS